MELINYHRIRNQALSYGATLVVVTKNQSIDDIMTIYNEGHRIFGENKAQDLIAKKTELPEDIEWHMIGNLQKNKVKSIAPWISMIHSVDSFDLAKKINQEARLAARIIPILLEIKISREESKHGFDEQDLFESLMQDDWKSMKNLLISGVMGMASFSNDTFLIRNEFKKLKSIYSVLHNTHFGHPAFKQMSFGMSSDYKIALAEGATMIRVGSKIFQD